MPGLSQWQAAVDYLANGDLLGITDVSDPSQSANGSSKKLLFSLLLSSLHNRVQNVSPTSGIITLDCATYHTFVVTITAGAEFSLTNMDTGQTIVLIISNGGSWITWPSNIKWPGGDKPDLSTTGQDRIVLQKLSATVTHGALAGLAYA